MESNITETETFP